MADTQKNPVQSSLIDNLVTDLTPVRPIKLSTVYVLGLLLQLVFIVGVAISMGVSSAIVGRLSSTAFAVLALTMAAGAGLAVMVAARLSVPGRYVPLGYSVALLSLPLMMALAIVLVAPWGAEWTGLTNQLSMGFPCTRTTVAIAVPAWIVGLVLLRRLAPLSPVKIGMLISMAALLQGALVVQFMCPVGDAYHLALCHYVPVLLGAGVAGLAAAAILRWKRSPRPR